MSLFHDTPPCTAENHAMAPALSLGSYIEPPDHHKNFEFAR
jgi:hypothetical protein